MIICLIDFGRSFWLWKGDDFCSHQLIKYPLNIIMMERILLFFPCLEGESLTFLFLLAFAIFVEIFTIGWLWACSDKGSLFLIGLLISSLLGCILF